MIKSPIPKVTNKLQYRAIGIINGTYKPSDRNKLNRGVLVDKKGEEIETVILGKALSLIKKYINLENNYYWIVYPKNKNTQKLHLQVIGIWNPNQLNNSLNSEPKKKTPELLEELNLTDNYFSVRGELVYVNVQKKEFIIKICPSTKSKKLKNNSFKLIIKGEISLDRLNNFVSLDLYREENTLKLINCEVIEKNHSKK